MVEEEDKPQKIPSWVDRGRAPKATLPTPAPGRAVNVNPRTPPNAPQAPRQMRQMRESAQQGYQHQNAEAYQDMGMVPAQHMGPVIAPMEHWGHLNPNFVFPGGQIDLGYALQTQERQATMGDASPDVPVPLSDTEHLQHLRPAQIHDRSPDARQKRSSILCSNSVARNKVVDDDPFASTSIEPVQPAKPYSSHSSAVLLPKSQPNISAEEINDIADKISKELSDEKKRQSYLSPPIAAATALISQHPPALPTRPTQPTLPPPPMPPPLTTLPPSNQVLTTLNPIPAPPSPITSLNAPSAPKLMMLRNGRDISRAGSAYLRANSNSPQSVKKDTETEQYQLREKLPVPPSKDTGGKARDGEHTRGEGAMQKKLPIRTASANKLEGDTRITRGETQKDVGSGNKHTSKDDGRLKSLMASTIAQAPPDFLNPWVRPPGSISGPTRNPFLDFDPSAPDPCVVERRRYEELAIQEKYKQEFQRLTESDVDKDRFMRRGGSAKDWPSKKSRQLEKLAKQHYKSRVGLERKHLKQDEEAIKAKDDHFVKVLADAGINIKDLRTTSGKEYRYAGTESSLPQRPSGDTTTNSKTGETMKHPKPQKTFLGIGGTGVASTTRPSTVLSTAFRDFSQGYPEETIHHIMLPSNDLWAPHERELRSLDEDTTAQEREEVIRRQRDEWDEWHAALPQRQAASREIGQDERTMSRREETNLRPVVYADTQTSEGAEESSGRKKKKRVRPNRYLKLTSSEIATRHADQISSLARGATEQEKRDILRKQENELIKWHAAQESQRQKEVKESNCLIPEGCPAKRKAIEGAEDGGSKKLVRLNSSAAVKPKAESSPLNVPVAPAFPFTRPAIPDGAVPSLNQEANGTTSVEKRERLVDEDTKMTDPSAEELNKMSVAEFNRVFGVVGNSAAFPQFGAPEQGSFEAETSGYMQVTTPIEARPVLQVREAMRPPQTIHTIQASARGLQSSQSSGVSRTIQTAGAAHAAQLPQVTQAAGPRSTSPPIPAGEWILDNLLDSLPSASQSSPQPPPPQPGPAPKLPRTCEFQELANPGGVNKGRSRDGWIEKSA
ncbi:hypothetical protein DL98DRAFT_530443 [Cadophora sp. DSE1049]|nr:hypothetical protein DL98DRAFT_530443 [Cadophora sp. DSE1049]